MAAFREHSENEAKRLYEHQSLLFDTIIEKFDSNKDEMHQINEGIDNKIQVLNEQNMKIVKKVSQLGNSINSKIRN